MHRRAAEPRTHSGGGKGGVYSVRRERHSLDDIAKEAGVGAGTLYRHFPTRDALIEAVYRTEVEKLAAAEKSFSESLPPIEALRAWMLLFVDYIATKQIIGPALNSLVGGPSKLYEVSRAQIQGAIDSLVRRAIKNRDMRRDLEPSQLVDMPTVVLRSGLARGGEVCNVAASSAFPNSS